VGSLAAALIAWLLCNRFGWRPEAIGILGIVTMLPAIWTAEVTARRSGLMDPQFVVIDEVVGQWIALGGALSLDWAGCAAGFALFRAFDIAKPFPVRRLEALPGGLGIVADDVMAGLYAALVLYAAGWFNLY
jgi:phosphatidylglycerophosphatase A